MRNACAVSCATTLRSLPRTLTALALASSGDVNADPAEPSQGHGSRGELAVHPLSLKGSTAERPRHLGHPRSSRRQDASGLAARATDGLRSENWTVVVPNVPLVSPEEAQRLLERGYTYVDVRSESEFAAGHAPGAVNIPLQRVVGDRLVDNPDFMDIVSRRFRTTDPLLLGCRSGGRSHVAALRLEQNGFQHLVELRHGFEGARDAFGRRLAGWIGHGLPVERGDAPGDYASVLEGVRAAERR